MMRILAGLLAGSLTLVALVGCGPNCQSTCDQVYIQCGIEKAGQTQQELVVECIDECESGLMTVGDIGDYVPDQFSTSTARVSLDNDAQAVAWMDCVWEHVPDGTPEQCEDLQPEGGNFCDPI